jgi:hypothetical protein
VFDPGLRSETKGKGNKDTLQGVPLIWALIICFFHRARFIFFFKFVSFYKLCVFHYFLKSIFFDRLQAVKVVVQGC